MVEAGMTAQPEAEDAYDKVLFLECFADLPDPRMRGKVSYPLDEILLLCLAAVLSGADGFAAIARYGEKKLAFLRRFRPFANGTPSHDQLGDVFAVVDHAAFRRCFSRWATLALGLPPEAIAFDGKQMRRSKGGVDENGDGISATHIVSAFCVGRRAVLGQVKVGDKSNEITAIPTLIGMIDMAGAVVTIDAMGCQREIAEAVVAKDADYVLALKGNQGALKDDVATLVDEQEKVGWRDVASTVHETVDGDHGRIETRRFRAFHDVDWLVARHAWPGLKGVVVVDSRRETKSKVETERRLFITSSPLDAERLSAFVRGHWAVENSLHWVLDMVFRDDESRVRTSHAPANLATVRHAAFNMLRLSPGKGSMRMKRHDATWDDDFLASLLSSKTAKAA